MITSTSNPQIKNLVLLGKKAKARREQGVFLAEGRKMLEEAPKEWIRRIYLSESFVCERKNWDCIRKMDYETLSDHVLKAAGDTQTPQGVLMVLAIPEWNFEEILKHKKGCYLFLENIQDPGNLGTMIRAGEAAGVTAVIADKTTVDLYNPKTVRATMGSIFRMPFLAADDFYGTIQTMKEGGAKIYAAHLDGKKLYHELDYRESCGFLIGNESSGLSETAAALAEERIRIPMQGGVESLNAAMAAAVLMYEADRQRRR